MNKELVIAKLKQYPVVVVCGVLVIAGLIASYLRLDILPSLVEQQEDLDRRWNVMRENDVAAVGLPEQIERIEEFLENVDERLLSPTDIAGNYRSFYQVEFNSGVNITNLVQGNPSAAGDGVFKPRLEHFTSIPYRVTLEGRFDQVLQFTHELEYGELLVRVDSFELLPAGGRDSRADRVRLNLTMEVLARRES